jgi:hypothetical protein
MSRRHEQPVPRLQASAQWQAESAQHPVGALLVCINVGRAGLTGGQGCSKRKRRVLGDDWRVSSEACTQIPLPLKPLLHTPPKLMHNQLDRGSTI